MTPLRVQLKEFWRRLSRPDLVAALVVVLGAILFATGRSGRVISFVKFAALFCLGYLLVRVIAWSRARLLWSLRNRLIVAYLFIALVPVVLTAVLAFLSATILYRQFGGYILYQDLQRRVDMVAAGTDQIAAALESALPAMQEEAVDRVIMAQEHAVYDAQLPGMRIEISQRLPLLDRVADASKRKFAGFIQQDKSLFLVGLRAVKTPYGERYVHIRVPVSASFVSSLAPELGPVEFQLLQPLDGSNQSALQYTLSGRVFQVAASVVDRHR